MKYPEYTDPAVQPEPMVCGHCGDAHGWVWEKNPPEEAAWELDAEWWHDEPRYLFLCSRRCYLAVTA